MERSVSLGPVTPADHAVLLDMNNQAAPAVNALTEEEWSTLLELSVWTRAAHVGGAPVAFLLGLDGPGLDYRSENYAWFSAAYDRFLYVDRVVVAPHARSRGLGGRLYDAFADFGTRVGHSVLCAEVNIDPPNPGSLRFHEHHGFRPVGEQDTKGGSVRVRMLARELRPGGPVGGDLVG